MKIVCQSCSATYKIADEKVQGKKVFKIKCKKCGEDILVRGTDLPAEPAAQQEEAAVASDAVWHAVVNGDQQGPFSAAQLQGMLAEGSVDGETYVWREGFEGWLPIVQVDELAGLLNPAASLSDAFPASVPDEPTTAGADLFASLVPPTAEPAPATSSGLFGALDTEAATRVSASVTAKTKPVKSGGGDLFAVEVRQQEAAKPLFTEEPAAAKEPPRGEHLTGQRNENSVLFSLATLQQLSGDEKPASGNAVMSGGGDSSGLIDINKLSGALNGDRQAKKSSVDDILSVGAASGLGAPLAAPVLTPVAVPVAPVAAPIAPAVAPAPQKSNAIVWVAAAGILGAAVLGAAFIVKSRGDDQPAPAVAQAPAVAPAAAPNPNAVTPPAPTAQPEAANPAPAAAAPAAPAPAAPAAAAPERPRERDRERDRERERPRTNAAAAAPAPAAAPAVAARTAPAPARPRAAGSGSVDDLMNAVVTGRPAAGAAAPAAASNVPETPDRAAVVSALRGVASTVRACGTGQGGVATVTVVFNNRGAVNTATVAPPVTGSQASCVSSAVRGAHIPPFGRPTFSVTYPYALQ